MKASNSARFDTRLTQEQKAFFEYAASLGGFRTLTEFALFSLQDKAKEIVKEHEAIIASKEDQEIFFKALMHPKGPNKKLREAAKKHKAATSGK